MNIVLLSGGSGKRLWPLSNEVRSKQFLKLIRGVDGGKQSMLQRVYGQLEHMKLAEYVTIVTSATQCEAIKNQLGDRPIVVVEPERRNTFPAIALAVAHLHFVQRRSPEETVIVLPVDPYVDDAYFSTFYSLDKAVKNNMSDIVLMGVAPTYPSEKYGYIIPGGNVRPDMSNVRKFKEKPTADEAEQLIAQGAFWNCGVFAFRLGYIMEELHERIDFSSYQEVYDKYSALTKTSFDYEIVERASLVSVIPYAGDWKDLGTWNTLTEVMDDDPIGQVIQAPDCLNTHVINELEIPIVTIGTKDMVIAACPDGILVADKEQSSFIKRYVDEFDRRPMFEERAWGEYQVLDISSQEDGMKTTTKSKTIRADYEIAYQSHKNRSEVWIVLSGRCIITIDGRAHEALAGDTYSITHGVGHGLKALTDTKILEVQVGYELQHDGTELIVKMGSDGV